MDFRKLYPSTKISQWHSGGFTIPNVSLYGSSPDFAVENATTLYNLGQRNDGVYWIKPSYYNGSPFQAYIKFNYIDGGHWHLILKIHSQSQMTSGNALWTNQTLQNENDFNLLSGNHSKYATWNIIKFNRLMYEMASRIPPIMIFNTARTMAESISAAGGVSNGAGLYANSTDPQIQTNNTYYNMPMKSGPNFPAMTVSEDIIQGYGIGMWANNASNNTSNTNGSSNGRAGAWIGAPLDEGGHTFNATSNNGADSGFGLGGNAGNNPRTWSSGIATWANGDTIQGHLPAYVWVR
jgi:hypothetical protein